MSKYSDGARTFDPSRVIADGTRYSPNLARWLRRNKRCSLPGVFLDDSGARWIGWNDEEYYFCGSLLLRVLCVGGRATVYAHPKMKLTEDVGFWDCYAAIGRCAVDSAHGMYFIRDEARWDTNGDERSCLWCGNHTQRLRKWTEDVVRERWEQVPSGAVTALAQPQALEPPPSQQGAD